MKPRHVLAIVLVWAALMGVYLGSTLGFSAHEFLSEEVHPNVLTNHKIESNGYLMRLFHVLIWVPLGAPHSDLYLRLPSLCFSLASLIALYFLGCELAPSQRRTVGVLSAFYLAVNALFISVLAHMRFYSANMFWIIVSTLCLVKATRTGSGRWLAGYALCMLAAIGTMMLSALVIVPHFIYYALGAKERTKIWRNLAGLGGGFALWFALLWFRDPLATGRFHYFLRDSWLTVFRPLLANGDIGSHYLATILQPEYNPQSPERTALMLATGLLLLAAVLVPLGMIRKQRGISLKNTLFAPSILVFGIVSYILVSISYKLVAIPPNFSWMLPFLALTLAQATMICPLRWGYLLIILGATYQTHVAFLIDGETNQSVMHTLNAFHRPGEPILVSTDDQPAWHYLRSIYGLNRRREPLTKPERIALDIAHNDGIVVFKEKDFPELVTALCQQRRPVENTIWIITFQSYPGGPDVESPEKTYFDENYYRKSIQRALGGIWCDCLLANGDNHSVIYRLTLPPVRQPRPQPLQYRWRKDRRSVL